MIIIFCTVITYSSEWSGVAAVGDQSESNERPRDLEEIDCSPHLFCLIPILIRPFPQERGDVWDALQAAAPLGLGGGVSRALRSEEHTSELQSR